MAYLLKKPRAPEGFHFLTNQEDFSRLMGMRVEHEETQLFVESETETYGCLSTKSPYYSYYSQWISLLDKLIGKIELIKNWRKNDI